MLDFLGGFIFGAIAYLALTEVPWVKLWNAGVQRVWRIVDWYTTDRQRTQYQIDDLNETIRSLTEKQKNEYARRIIAESGEDRYSKLYGEEYKKNKSLRNQRKALKFRITLLESTKKGMLNSLNESVKREESLRMQLETAKDAMESWQRAAQHEADKAKNAQAQYDSSAEQLKLLIIKRNEVQNELAHLQQEYARIQRLYLTTHESNKREEADRIKAAYKNKKGKK